MKITTEMTRSAYAAAKDVYERITKLGDALDHLESDFGMNRGTANDYIYGFNKMMSGERYKRTFNSEATDYYFNNIYMDYGLCALRNALQAATAHVEYYEGLGRGNLNSIRSLIAEYQSLIFTEQSIYPDDLDEPEVLLEGHKKRVFVNSYERNPRARAKCVEHYGTTCSVCEMNFGEVYGELGQGFIHVHHLLPVSQLGKEYEVDPVLDLRPVCPNCHAMLHRRNPPLSISELKEMKKGIRPR
ncbi:HNH endonuclease [Marinobacterium arenosum]|uniref:HNH endonuclease n=1 Tax=Marinobacterium arenosum TaxID=2862496 RepID=UPI001C94A18B|nr:HNH endonuclease [Marinobacterium arenosum]MBY4677442.1 HNH endonuclease [Marinobacterium arenosum]